MQANRVGVSQAYRYWRSNWTACAAAVVVVIVYAWRVVPMTPGHDLFATPADHHKYLYMAEHGAWSFHIAPFCWRPGVPFVVELLPVSPQFGFYAIAMCCLAATAFLVYQTGLVLGKASSIAAFAMALFLGVGWAVKNPLFDFYLPDAAAQMLVWLCVYLILRRRWFGVAVALCIGVLVKESVLVAAPMVVTLADTSWRTRRTWTRAIVVILPAVVLLLAVRVTISPKNHDAACVEKLPLRLTLVDTNTIEYDYAARVGEIVSQRLEMLREHSVASLHAYTIGSFGVLAFLMVAFDLPRNKGLLLRISPFLILVYAQLLFATDTQRLLVLGLPGLILPAMNGVERLSQRLGHGAAQMLLLALPMIFVGWVYADRTAGPTSVEVVVIACCLLILFLRRGIQPRNGVLKDASSA